MTAFPSVFPLWWIVNSAIVAAAVSAAVLLWWRWKYQAPTLLDVLLLAVVVGLSVMLWRLVGNVAQLNDDPVAGFSPNDVLCPVITYVLLSMVGAFRQSMEPTKWERLRVVLTFVSLIVNVVTI